MSIYKNHIIFAIAVLSIVGGIFYIESQKVSRSVTNSQGEGDINIEKLVLGGGGDVEEEGFLDEGNSKVEGDSEMSEVSESVPSTISAEKRISAKKELFEVAKEISTPDGFINVDNITISELIGKKIILVDFWTYSCINCQLTLP